MTRGCFKSGFSPPNTPRSISAWAVTSWPDSELPNEVERYFVPPRPYRRSEDFHPTFSYVIDAYFRPSDIETHRKPSVCYGSHQGWKRYLILWLAPKNDPYPGSYLRIHSHSPFSNAVDARSSPRYPKPSKVTGVANGGIFLYPVLASEIPPRSISTRVIISRPDSELPNEADRYLVAPRRTVSIHT